MATLFWDKESYLLRAKNYAGETLFTWTYPMFEDWTGEAIKPSAYYVMAGYIISNITHQDLESIVQGSYNHGPLVAVTVDYWEASSKGDACDEWIEILETDLAEAREKETAAMNWILDEDETFYENFECISGDVRDFVRGLVHKYREKSELCDRLLAEERAMDLD